MAKKSTKKTLKPVRPQLGDGVEILNAGSVLEDPITRTLETNYMPYAMSVIVSRALPEIDGFKPAHRKLLYTMYEMGLLKGARTKSANIVGSTMHLNPHGDAAIYDTMVRMGRGNESLLVPFVDSKGNFGKAYSRDMSCAAARYTEAKLEGVSNFGNSEFTNGDNNSTMGEIGGTGKRIITVGAYTSCNYIDHKNSSMWNNSGQTLNQLVSFSSLGHCNCR